MDGYPSGVSKRYLHRYVLQFPWLDRVCIRVYVPFIETPHNTTPGPTEEQIQYYLFKLTSSLPFIAFHSMSPRLATAAAVDRKYWSYFHKRMTPRWSWGVTLNTHRQTTYKLYFATAGAASTYKQPLLVRVSRKDALLNHLPHLHRRRYQDS